MEDEDCAIETELTADGATRVVVTGVPAHASTPDKGKNAGKMLLRVLRRRVFTRTLTSSGAFCGGTASSAGFSSTAFWISSLSSPRSQARR